MLPPFIGRYGYVKPFTITVIETEHLSFEGVFNNGKKKGPGFYRETQCTIEAKVRLHCKYPLLKSFSVKVYQATKKWIMEVLSKFSREVDELVFKIYGA